MKKIDEKIGPHSMLKVFLMKSKPPKGKQLDSLSKVMMFHI